MTKENNQGMLKKAKEIWPDQEINPKTLIPYVWIREDKVKEDLELKISLLKKGIEESIRERSSIITSEYDKGWENALDTAINIVRKAGE